MKKTNKTVILDGSTLTTEQINTVVLDKSVEVSIDPQALSQVNKSRIFLEAEMKQKIIYGVNTGFGPMASHVIGNGDLVELQYNLIRSHATGMGDPISDDYVLAAMIIRLNTLLRGYSGVSKELVQVLAKLINKRIIPVVPEHGAVGTSGDLVQLAHIALALIGEGEVSYCGKKMSSKLALKKTSISPYALKAKEGLSLINGTAMMTGVSTVLYFQAKSALALELKNSALALELVSSYSDSLSQTLHKLRPHKGQEYVAKELRNLLKDSKRLQKRRQLQKRVVVSKLAQEIPEIVQEIYSFRCTAQILGPLYENLESIKSVLEIEMNSVTDNPIVDWKKKNFLHGGNFHGDYVATAIDHLKVPLTKLTLLSERRINFFLNKNLNKTFPYFANLNKPGLTLGLQGLQFVATSTTANNQTLAFPHSIHSISTNADNQDVVSMGTDAALITANLLNNVFTVLTIESVVLSQVAKCLNLQSELSTSSQKLLSSIRSIFQPVTKDRGMRKELEELVRSLKGSVDIK